MSTSEEVGGLTAKGWKVVFDGPTGVQLSRTKPMRTLDKICLVAGILTIVFAGVGLLLIAIALFDYFLMTAPNGTMTETKFVARTT